MSSKFQQNSQNKEISLKKLLLCATVHGVLVGTILGGIIGLFMWREAVKEIDVIVIPKAQNPPQSITCPSCPVMTCVTHGACNDSSNPRCISRQSDLFMKTEADVKNYSNPRIVPVAGILTVEESLSIIKLSKVAQHKPGTLLTFPRDEKTWEWLYERIHNEIRKQNGLTWHYTLPSNIRSELIEDLQLIAYSNQSAPAVWRSDLSAKGLAGKRMLSATVALNSDYSGGQYLAMISSSDFEVKMDEGVLWIANSFLLRRKLPVEHGVQYLLHYYVQRY